MTSLLQMILKITAGLRVIPLICRHPFYHASMSVVGRDNHATLSSLKKSCSQGCIRLIEAFENYGHKVANVNPLQASNGKRSELDPSKYGLSMDQHIPIEGGVLLLVKDLVTELHRRYCGQISIEAMTVDCADERAWLHECFNAVLSKPLDAHEKKRICRIMLESQVFDNFLSAKFPTLKRYSGEGAESMLPFIERSLMMFASSGLQELVIGMPHRGRNNLLVGLLKFPVEVMLRKIKGLSEFPEDALSIATGDVLSHLGISTDVITEDGKKVHVNLLCNSSFLESVNPVAMGKCWGRQRSLGLNEDHHNKAACLLLHGDASFAGQGVIMETMNMSCLPDFSVGGTIHLVVNNQVGFTTPPHLARSTEYATDIGKMIGCPVIHVNGDNPEAVWRAAEIAVLYQQRYKKDIIVDLLCFRRWGHNEMDDPSFTQPLLYDAIEKRLSVPDKYKEKVISDGQISHEEIDLLVERCWNSYNLSFKECEDYTPEATYLSPHSQWGGMQIPSSDHVTSWDTGCHVDELRFIGAKSVKTTDEFKMHGHLQKSHADARIDRLVSTSTIDWALAETFAFGSLLLQGYDVRLCGQDAGRGTFSHRHLALTCQDFGGMFYPLNHMGQKSRMEVVSSLLSEEAVLGFEYGVSIESPNRLVVWEAQFGDFFTGAQIPIDTLVMSGEAKWMYQSGLVILLPHGYDGAGPEHSSCRIERFLQCTNSKEDGVDGDDVNASVCHPTTAAQYFHLLRRQMLRNFRKPLIVAAPKMLLRYQAAFSPLEHFIHGNRFYPVLLEDIIQEPQRTHKVIYCSGKHYYALSQERDRLVKSGAITQNDVTLVRLEELCPFPTQALRHFLSLYPNASSHVWAQEEPRNMGAWSFVAPRFENILGVKLRYTGRPALAAPAVGIGLLHTQQSEQLLSDAFK